MRKPVSEFSIWPIAVILGAVSLIVWTGIDGPILTAFAEAKPADWLGFTGSIIAALIALGAAYVAIRPVVRQLDEMRKQSAAAAIPNFRVIAIEIEEELSAMKLVDRQLNVITSIINEYDNESFNDIYGHWTDRVHTLSSQVFDAWQLLSNRSDRDSTTTALAEARPDGIVCLKTLIEALADFGCAFRAQTSGPSYEDGEVDISTEEAEQARAAVLSAQGAWHEWYNRYVEIGLSSRRAAWDRVRQTEAAAAGGR